MKTKNWVVFGIASAMTLGMLTGCQSKETAAETEAAQETDNGSEVAADATFAEVEASQTEETVPEATEEETVAADTEEFVQGVSFMEANGLQLSSRSEALEMPVCVYYTTELPGGEEPAIIPVLAGEQTGSYGFSKFRVSEPDENGNVTYRFSLGVALDLRAYENTLETYDIGVMLEGFRLMDLYTGTVFPEKAIDGDGEYEASTEIVWDNVTYPVSYTRSVEWKNSRWTEWKHYANDSILYRGTVTQIESFLVTVPEDYDGLALCIYNKGMTYYQESGTELSKAHRFELEDGESWDDYTFIRVSDDTIPEDNFEVEDEELE